MTPLWRVDEWGERVVRVLMIVTTVGMLGVVSLVGYWLVQPTPYIITGPALAYTEADVRAIQRKDGTKVPHTSRFSPGDIMWVSRARCVSRQSSAIVRREFVHVSGFPAYPLPSLVVHVPTGCSLVFQPTIIPTELPPGDYAYRVIAAVQVNPLRTTLLALPDVPITVLAKTIEKGR